MSTQGCTLPIGQIQLQSLLSVNTDFLYARNTAVWEILAPLSLKYTVPTENIIGFYKLWAHQIASFRQLGKLRLVTVSKLWLFL